VSLVTALVIAVGKIAISLLSAFAIVYFRFPVHVLVFWAIFITLMLPVEVRILPDLQGVSDLGMLNTYAGLTVPLIASATATFLFRQFFLTVPDELVEAARIDGAGPMRFFKDVLLPLSRTNLDRGAVRDPVHLRLEPVPVAAAGDHQRRDMYPVVMGIKRMISGGDAAMRMERGDGHRHPGHAAAGAGGDADAEMVRQGPGGHGKIRSAWLHGIDTLKTVVKRYTR
jgi:sn-glycerol 3-phosphate transport system permease protein